MTYILIVDDSPEDREHLSDLLEAQEHFCAHSVATGTEALTQFDAKRPDCVILDLRLESESGIDVLAHLKEHTPYCPVIMLTGQGDEEVAAKVIKLGASDYLVKHRLSATSLITSVRNAIGRAALEMKVAEQEAERRQFLNILVHDLRQPLRSVAQIASMAIEDADTGDFVGMKKLLRMQKVVADRADDLVATLSEYALLDGAVTFSPVSLTEAAMAAKDNLRLVISETNTVVEIGELPDVQGHFPQLVQLFQNLIGNGLKYNRSDAPKISVTSTGVGDEGNLVCVTDNGIGIPEKYLQEIFRPLKRLWRSEDFEGTGLGLATCQKIMDRHEGRIWCRSVQNTGSVFNMIFPTLETQ